MKFTHQSMARERGVPNVSGGIPASVAVVGEGKADVFRVDMDTRIRQDPDVALMLKARLHPDRADV